LKPSILSEASTSLALVSVFLSTKGNTMSKTNGTTKIATFESFWFSNGEEAWPDEIRPRGRV